MRAIVLFIAVVYGLSVALSGAVWATGGAESPYVGFGLAAMFFPALAVLAVRLTLGAKVETMGWGRFPLIYLPVALLIFPLVMHAVMLPLMQALEGGIPWAPGLTPDENGLLHPPESRGGGEVTVGQFAQRVAINAGVGVISVAVFAFFEEIGWRAWLQPRLSARLGLRAGVLATALIWAFWHTPFAFSGIHHIPAMSALELAAIAPVGHVGAGLIIGWLWVRTRSIWMVALAHGSLNNWGQYAFKYMSDAAPGAASHDAVLLFAGNLALLVVGGLLVLGLRPAREADRAPAPS